MGLGYLTLAIQSDQDKYLTGNPEFTFFKSVYKRHTNFAIDYQFVNFVGDANNAFGKKLYLDIPKNGDLLHKSHLVIDISGFAGLKEITPAAYSLVEYIDLFIGGQRLDRLYGTWLQAWHELYEDKDVVLGRMISTQPISTSSNSNKLYIPLRFWFNNDIGVALPLIALQYNDIKIEVKFNSKVDVQTYSKYDTTSVQDTTLTINQVQLLCQYIHLDKEERRLFASNPLEYLITQLQTSLNNPINLNSTDNDETFHKTVHKTNLRFSHPVKELVWSFQDHNALISQYNTAELKNYNSSGVLSLNNWRNFTVGNDHLIGANLTLNGKDMTEELPGSFYRNIQQYEYHSANGLGSLRNTNTSANAPSKRNIDYSSGSGFYSFSFSLSPQDFQPAGSINFSKLEQAQLKYRLFRPVLQDTLAIRVATIKPIVDFTVAIPSIDGITLAENDIVIVRAQNTNDAHNNGIYVINNQGLLIRHPNYSSVSLMLSASGSVFKVLEGNTLANKFLIMSFKDEATGNLGDVGNDVKFIEYKSTTEATKITHLITTPLGGTGATFNNATSTFENVVGNQDGYSRSANDLILITNQDPDSSRNGIYITDTITTTLVRLASLSNSDQIKNASGRVFQITSGTSIGQNFILSIEDKTNFVLNTDDINFFQYEVSNFELISKVLSIYAVNYNILRIVSGMASIAFNS